MSIVYVTKTFVLIAIKMQIIVLLSYCGLMNSSVRIKVRGKRFSYLFMSLYFLLQGYVWERIFNWEKCTR